MNYNNLSAIDISHNNALKSLYAQYNQINSITHLEHLEELGIDNSKSIKKLYHSATPLTQLNIAGNKDQIEKEPPRKLTNFIR